jgi:PAS domain S-box-containing protein
LGSLKNGIVVIDARTPLFTIAYCNEAFARANGNTVVRVLSQNTPVLQFLSAPPKEPRNSESLEIVKRALNTGTACTANFVKRRADGSELWVEFTLVPHRDAAGQLLQFIGTETDITGLRQAEEDLRKTRTDLERRVAERTTELSRSNESLYAEILDRRNAEQAAKAAELKFRSIFENSVEGIYQSTPAGKYLSVNPALARMYGYATSDELLNSVQDIANQVYVDPQVRDRFCDLMREQGEVRGLEYQARRRDGSILWISEHARAVRNRAHRILYYEGTIQDITERKRAEEAHLESETRFRIVAEQTGQLIYDYDLSTGRIVWAGAIESVTGETPASFRSVDMAGWEERVHPDDRALVVAERELRRAACERFDREYRFRRSDGTYARIRDNAVYLPDENGQPARMLGAMRDITARRKAEAERERLAQQLRQSQKMDAIGTLAGGIAHDFNNILGSILGYTELALDDIPPDTLTSRNLQQVVKAAGRAKQLVSQILAFSRQAEPVRKAVRLGELIREVLSLIRASLPSTIEIQTHISADPDWVNADPTQLHQVMMNLCANAGHAMAARGGLLTVTLAETHPGKNEGMLRLSVRDTGTGMRPEVLDRIFEPFFTTKQAGEGTGLGLSVVHGIVKSHGGEIHASSELGEGSVFEILLPKSVPDGSPILPAKSSPAHGRGKLLVVDDEEALLGAMSQRLTRMGYEVVTEADSARALDLVALKPYEFDLVITDVTMPKLTGIKLAQFLRSIRADLPVIMCSGNPGNVEAEAATLSNVRTVLRKPLDIAQLSTLIRECLGPTADPARQP